MAQQINEIKLIEPVYYYLPLSAITIQRKEAYGNYVKATLTMNLTVKKQTIAKQNKNISPKCLPITIIELMQNVDINQGAGRLLGTFCIYILDVENNLAIDWLQG